MAGVNPSLKGKPSSRIPRLQRSASFHGERRKSSITQEQEFTEEDLTEAQDDVGSLSSVCSVASCAVSSRAYPAYRKAVETACDFQKGNNSPKFTFHCSTPTNGCQGEYLTPTQRANRTIRQLKSLLKESEANSNYKDFEIQRLTRELVGLRLEHAQCEKRISGGDKESDGATHLTAPSLADSGHFDDLSYHPSQFKDSFAEKDADLYSGGWTAEKNRLTNAYLEKIENLTKQHTNEMQDVKSRFTDRLESALTQLSDSNTRYANLLTSHDLTREELERVGKEKVCLRQHIESLERKIAQLQNDMEERETLEYETREKELIQIESLTRELAEKTEMISELQSKLEDMSVVTDSSTTPNNDQEDCSETQHLQTVASALEQQEELKNSCSRKCLNKDSKDDTNHINHPSADPSILLKFLRSAIFYLLTDSENGAEHLRAIQSILEFSPEERYAVERAARHGYL
ncbi:protein quick-to-court-like isoform X1 [Daphnia pulex]|uniref:protein quick-to-court-like isoform X1 n=1 Tax=Daphnia pulex TaxID=6669 RepID=UPI001EE0037D|nr:protein quick-to-court-like isoform X1 [Daphnia pulex]